MSTYHDKTDILRRSADIHKGTLWKNPMKKPYERALWKRPMTEPYKWVHTMITQTFSADVQTFSEESSIVSVSTKLNCELTLENTYVWQIPQKMLRPPNPPDRKLQIPQYLAVQIHIEILVWFERVQRDMNFLIRWVRTCSMNLSYSLHALMAENNSADRRIFSKVNWTISLNDKLSCYLTLENVCALFA